MTAVETVQRWEYEQATEITRVKWLAEQGWRLHSAVPCGGNVWYVMERPVETGPWSTERVLERMLQARDWLAIRVQRVRDLHRPATTEVGLPASAEPRCVVCKTPAPCDTVRALDPRGQQ